MEKELDVGGRDARRAELINTFAALRRNPTLRLFVAGNGVIEPCPGEAPFALDRGG
jgi:hypothetical protein